MTDYSNDTPKQDDPQALQSEEINSSPALVRVRLPHDSPKMTYTIMGITIVIYMLQVATNQILGYDLPAFLGMKVNELISEGQWWRLLTPVLLHGSIIHIGVNMYALYILGPVLEDFYDHWKFLMLYLVSALGGATFSFILTDNPSLGASTAIFGLIAANGVFVYHNRMLYGKRAQEALRSMISVAVINLVIGLAPGIDNWAHLGGLLGGLAVSWFGGPVYKLAGAPPEYGVIDQRKRGVFSLTIVFTALAFILLAFY